MCPLKDSFAYRQKKQNRRLIFCGFCAIIGAWKLFDVNL